MSPTRHPVPSRADVAGRGRRPHAAAPGLEAADVGLVQRVGVDGGRDRAGGRADPRPAAAWGRAPRPRPGSGRPARPAPPRARPAWRPAPPRTRRRMPPRGRRAAAAAAGRPAPRPAGRSGGRRRRSARARRRCRGRGSRWPPSAPSSAGPAPARPPGASPSGWRRARRPPRRPRSRRRRPPRHTRPWLDRNSLAPRPTGALPWRACATETPRGPVPLITPSPEVRMSTPPIPSQPSSPWRPTARSGGARARPPTRRCCSTGSPTRRPGPAPRRAGAGSTRCAARADAGAAARMAR